MTQDDEVRNLDWFLARVGRMIYREDNGCECLSCRQVTKKGVHILDPDHAKNLHVIHGESGLKFYDEPQKRKH